MKLATMETGPGSDRAAVRKTADKHTAAGIALNLLLLLLIAYGFWQSENWRWAWGLVAVPIIVVTVHYARHLLKG